MRFITHLLLGAAALTLPEMAVAAKTDPQPVLLGKIAGLTDIFVIVGAPVLETAAGDYQILLLPGKKPTIAPLPAIGKTVVPAPPDIIPHARTAIGIRDIRAAWFASPTKRYDHGVLGDPVEAAALKIETASGAVLSHILAGESVFEDLTPRLADIDGDGRDEIIVVHSYANRGSAVALFGIRDGKLVRLAESDPIGLPHRWLNPIGAGDFTGNGTKEIAVIQTPHIGGTLILYRWEGNRLAETTRRFGFSNHHIGSTVLGMSTVLDIDGDGAQDILVPDNDRTTLQAVSHADGDFRVLWSIPNDNRIVTSIVATDLDGNGMAEILYGLADGSVLMLVF
jgi:hypothetical protein